MTEIIINVERIALRRLEKKLWQFEDCEPKRVELAVLDYLMTKGWRGYFSEHFDFDQTILVMMCWCNRVGYFEEKRKSLPYENVRDFFNFASDGFWELDRHKLSHSCLMANAESFSADNIPEIIEIWKKRDVKGGAVGSPYYRGKRSYSPRPATDLSSDILVSFFNARGGRQYYLDYLNCFHSAEFQILKNRRRILDQKIYEVLGGLDPLRDILRVSGTYLQALSPLGWVPTDGSISQWIRKIVELENSDLKDEILELAEDIQGYWRKHAEDQGRWNKRALLDLVVWKDNVVSVEVKAPNDRLQSHQIEQLKWDAKNGIKSWVVEVEEGESSFSDNSVKAIDLNKKSNSLADISEQLKSLGRWEDITKGAIYCLTTGKDIKNWDQVSTYLCEYPHLLNLLKEYREKIIK